MGFPWTSGAPDVRTVQEVRFTAGSVISGHSVMITQWSGEFWVPQFCKYTGVMV